MEFAVMTISGLKHRPLIVAAVLIGLGISKCGKGLADEPRVNDTGQPNPLRDIVLHAGGVVEFQMPVDWDLTEVPHGREIRLTLRPSKVGEVQDTTSLIWVSFHVRRAGQLSDEQLETWFAKRLRRTVAGNQVLNKPQPLVVGGYDGIEQQYSRAVSHEVMAERIGQQAAVSTPWGILEVHWRTDQSQQQRLEKVAAELLATVKFNRPAEQVKGAVHDSASGARPILGSWKAYRSRMTLGSDGHILLAPDSAPIHLGTRPPHKQVPIVGEFEAKDDVLAVRWNDGSLLNFRWRLDGEHLLLTDHNGRTTLLNPLFD
jgi:hypothetical protein